jgi:primary-amine oxidase
LQRHTTDYYVSATKNVELTLRYVAVMGNYDYTFGYTFSLDGSIRIDVRASGYIQAAYAAHNEQYGFKIRENLSGSMHDHVINFKADFDVMGTRNTVQLMKFVPTTETYPWSKGQPRRTMKLETSVVESEDSSRLSYDMNLQTMLLVVNTDETTKAGEYKGYRIQPTTPGTHLTAPDSTVLSRAANWANHDVQVTRRKDTEPRSAHCYNNQDVHNPPVDFDAFFDGESLVQEDLVVWVNVGMHHVPSTADLPNTVATNAHAGVAFLPNNFMEWDASRRTANMVRVAYSDGVVEQVKRFGMARDTCPRRYSPVEVDLFDYTGDVVVRKFPYEPDRPYYETESIQ